MASVNPAGASKTKNEPTVTRRFRSEEPPEALERAVERVHLLDHDRLPDLGRLEQLELVVDLRLARVEVDAQVVDPLRELLRRHGEREPRGRVEDEERADRHQALPI